MLRRIDKNKESSDDGKRWIPQVVSSLEWQSDSQGDPVRTGPLVFVWQLVRPTAPNEAWTSKSTGDDGMGCGGMGRSSLMIHNAGYS